MANLQTITPEQLYEQYMQLNVGPSSTQSTTILFNMVATIDGVINIRDDKSGLLSDKGLGGVEDSRLMRIIRSKADCILNGANTLRVRDTSSLIGENPELLEERKRLGKSENPIAAVLTTDANFDEEVLQHDFFVNSQYQSILFVSEDAPEENLEKVRATAKENFFITPLPHRADNVKDLVNILHENFHVQTLLVEGGAGINGSFISHGLGDHFFLTISPHMAIASPTSKSITQGLTSLSKDNMVDLTLVSAYYVTSFGGIFQHWQFKKE